MSTNKKLRYAFVPKPERVEENVDRSSVDLCINGLKNLVMDFAKRLGLPEDNIFGLASREEILNPDKSKSAEYYLNTMPSAGESSIIRITFEEITREEFDQDGE